MEAAVLMALANQSHTRKPPRKKEERQTFLKQKSIQRDLGCQSVSPAGLTWRASQCRGGHGGIRTKIRPCSLPTRSPATPELRHRAKQVASLTGEPRLACALCPGAPAAEGPQAPAWCGWPPSTTANWLHQETEGAGAGSNSVLIWILLEETLELGIHPSRARTDGKSSA